MKKNNVITVIGIMFLSVLILSYVFNVTLLLFFKDDVFIETLGYVENEEEIEFIITSRSDIPTSGISGNLPYTLTKISQNTCIVVVDVSKNVTGTVFISINKSWCTEYNSIELSYDNATRTISNKTYSSENTLTAYATS